MSKAAIFLLIVSKRKHSISTLSYNESHRGHAQVESDLYWSLPRSTSRQWLHDLQIICGTIYDTVGSFQITLSENCPIPEKDPYFTFY